MSWTRVKRLKGANQAPLGELTYGTRSLVREIPSYPVLNGGINAFHVLFLARKATEPLTGIIIKQEAILTFTQASKLMTVQISTFRNQSNY